MKGKAGRRQSSTCRLAGVLSLNPIDRSRRGVSSQASHLDIRLAPTPSPAIAFGPGRRCLLDADLKRPLYRHPVDLPGLIGQRPHSTGVKVALGSGPSSPSPPAADGLVDYGPGGSGEEKSLGSEEQSEQKTPVPVLPPF
jgi:hypothetical protein